MDQQKEHEQWNSTDYIFNNPRNQQKFKQKKKGKRSESLTQNNFESKNLIKLLQLLQKHNS